MLTRRAFVGAGVGGVCLLPYARARAQAPLQRRQRISVADCIGTTRFLSKRKSKYDQPQHIFVSPDGRYYGAPFIRGDLENNGNWCEVLIGRLGSLTEASNPRVVARLFMSSLGETFEYGLSQLSLPLGNSIAWSRHELTLLWGNDAGIAQLVAIHADSGEFRFLTRHASHINAYEIASNGTIIFSASRRRSPEASIGSIARGFVVENPDLYSVLSGYADGTSVDDLLYQSELFVQLPHSLTASQLRFSDTDFHNAPPSVISLSPSGRAAIVDAFPAEIPRAWDSYREPVFQTLLQERRASSRFREERRGRFIRQPFVVDTEAGSTRPLWDAPLAIGARITWSPNNESVIIGPTFLPRAFTDEAAASGQAIAEVNVTTGRVRRLPFPETRRVEDIQWPSPDLVVVALSDRSIQLRKSRGNWRISEEGSQSPAAGRVDSLGIDVVVRQDINTPPAIVVTDGQSGTETVAHDLNPGLASRFQLGHAEQFGWSDSDGREWSGLLYKPSDFDPDRRYPLVIQTHGHASPSEFSLYGYWLTPMGPGVSAFAAQPLASRGIAVLHIEDKRVEGVSLTPEEPQMYAAAYEAAIAALSARGLVDASRVGLMGYSRTGWHVEYALSHSEFPYAAALICDNFSAEYMMGAALGWPQAFATYNGAEPFGEGLQAWLEHSPAFNADRIRAPLRMHLESLGLPGLLSYWELYSRLRKLERPVELYVAPDIAHGSHALQNPHQCYASQQGAVDWFSYWLTDEEDDAPQKQELYVRWRLLRGLRDRRL